MSKHPADPFCRVCGVAVPEAARQPIRRTMRYHCARCAAKWHEPEQGVMMPTGQIVSLALWLIRSDIAEALPGLQARVTVDLQSSRRAHDVLGRHRLAALANHLADSHTLDWDASLQRLVDETR